MTLAEVLAGIDARTIPLEILKAPDFCNYPEYRAAGWTFQVFDDAGEWDYLEWAESPDGRRIAYAVKPYEKCSDEEKLVLAYAPEHEEDWGY